MAESTTKRRSRLAESAYNSPYSHSGAPVPHPNTDPYAELRAKALATLEAMGYEPDTMVERGVLWAEDQDPFGHVMHAQFVHYLGHAFHRQMEGYDEHLSEKEYSDMLTAKTIVPMIKQYGLDIKRQVQYPDSLISAHRCDRLDPDRSNATVSLFSLKQQKIVAEVKGSVAFVDVKNGRPADIRKLGGGWPKLYQALLRRSDEATAKKETCNATASKKSNQSRRDCN